jgi:hypothetical protein
MQQWLKANGGPMGLVVLGLASYEHFPSLAAILILVGVFLWLNASRHFPWRIAREAKLALQITHADFTTHDALPGRVQLKVSVRNDGAPTTLHSWHLELQSPEHVEEGLHLDDAESLSGRADIGSLSEKTRLEALGRGTERGYLYFRMPMLKRAHVADIAKHGMLRLTVTDQNGRNWVLKQDIATLAAGGIEES